MSDLAVRDRLLLGLRASVAPIGEFIHVSAIYMGLAVLTTLGLSLVLPSMRQQSQQLHEVVLAMFQANDQAYDTTDDSDLPDWTLLTTAPPVASGTPSSAAATQMAPSTASSKTPAPSAGGTASVPAGSTAAVPKPAASAKSAAPEPQLPETLNFNQALLASMQDKPIKGLTKAQDHGLRSYLARKYRIAPSVAGAMIRTAFAVGREEKVDPQLLLAVIAIESRYNPFVESAVGAQGLMQIMGNVHRDKLKAGGGKVAVFNPIVNIQVGAQILSDCIRRRGSVQGGLACYVGATGQDGGYGARVLAERRRIALASGLPPGQG